MSASGTQHRLHRHADYGRVYKAARKQWAREMAYFSAVREPGSTAEQRSATPGPRIGLTVPKATVRRAVDRNRMKRRLREVVRGALPQLDGVAVDVVLHPKRSVLDMSFVHLTREVTQIFRSVRARASSSRKAAQPVPHDVTRK